jgi:hypothetical protein
MNFGNALEHLKAHPGTKVTRRTWYGSAANPVVKLQVPDEYSKMTEPYLYMEKNHPVYPDKQVRFPLDLSCESILAEDWIAVE